MQCLAAGALVAVKAFDAPAARDTEVGCYKRLKTLQGNSILVLLNQRLSLRWSKLTERRIHAFMVTRVGYRRHQDKAGAGPAGLSAPALLEVRRILERFHRLGVAHCDVWEPNFVHEGVAHCDVWEPNFVHDPTNGRVFVFDFSHSSWNMLGWKVQ
jgi:methyl coenzyme M reductase beta subunit